MKLNDWKSLLALPLTLGVLATIVLAFNAAGSVQFAAAVGSFLAAMVTAGAVVGQHAYQSALTVDREDRSTKRALVAGAVHLNGTLVFLINTLSNRVGALKASPFATQADGIERDSDPCGTSAGQFRNDFVTATPEQLNTAIEYAAQLPASVGKPIIEALNWYMVAKGSWLMLWLPDERQLNRSVVNSQIQVSESHKVTMERAQGLVAAFIMAQAIE